MKHTIKLIIIILVVVIASNSYAQMTVPDKTNDIKHSHPEYEESSKEMQHIVKKAEITIEQAQEMYKLSKDFYERNKTVDDRFFKWLPFLIAVIFSGLVASLVFSIKTMKLFYKNLLEKNYKMLAEKNLATIKKMINNEDWSNKMRTEKKILVLNKSNTGMKPEFMKVIPTFSNYQFTDLTNLEDSVNIDYSGFDLVIIENCDDKGYWKLVAENRNDPEEIKEVEKVKNIFIALGNKICPKTALIYYGKQGRGFFPSELVDEDKQHMISYANTPSTLFGNMIDLLKFKDIIEGQQLY